MSFFTKIVNKHATNHRSNSFRLGLGLQNNRLELSLWLDSRTGLRLEYDLALNLKKIDFWGLFSDRCRLSDASARQMKIERDTWSGQ
jgi:hypothetical protein